MNVVAAAAHRKPLEKLLDDVLTRLKSSLGEIRPDLGCVFLSNHFEEDAETIATRLRTVTGVRTLVGCSGESIIGPEEEYEEVPALSTWFAAMPGVDVAGFHVDQAQMNDADDAAAWRILFKAKEGEKPTCLAFGDPFSLDANEFLQGFNQHLPGTNVIGGMASGAEAPGQAALILNDDVHREGVVGVRLRGARVASVVSQGCRPVGQPFVITRSERNVIHQLGGKKPLDVLNQLFREAPTSEQALMQHGVFVGRVINENRPSFHRGDFLIRNLLGADEDSGALAIGDMVRTGATIQFHVRDAATATEDLKDLLKAHQSQPPAGALLFSCNGRGTRLFDAKDHDVTILRQSLGKIPVAGFFCAGELGPIGGKNFIHGHTASLALFQY